MVSGKTDPISDTWVGSRKPLKPNTRGPGDHGRPGDCFCFWFLDVGSSQDARVSGNTLGPLRVG